MNRIGVMADSFRLEILKALDAAREVGAGAVQIYVGGRGAVQEIWTSRRRRDVRQKLLDDGLHLSAMCGDMGGHGFMVKEEQAWRIDETRRMFDLTRELGGDVLTTHIGVVPEDAENPRRAVMLEALHALAGFGKEAGCRLAVETGPERPPVLKRFLEDAQGEGFLGVNYDPANLKMVLDEDPVAGVHVLKDYILHTHAKDGKLLKYVGPEAVYGFFAEGGIGDLRIGDCFLETPLGEGQVDFPGWVAALNEIGYQGYMTIEREVGDDPRLDIERAVAFLRELGV